MLPRFFLLSFKSTGPMVQKKKRKIGFQDGSLGGHLRFLIRKILAIFDLQKSHSDASYEVSTGILVQEKKQKIDFPDCGHGGHLGFWIGTILAIFDLQVTPMLLTKFQVYRPFSSGKEAKNRFKMTATDFRSE